MPLVTAGSVAAVVLGLALDQGGFFPHTWVWAPVVLLWLAALALGLRTEIRVARRELVWLAGVAALSGWTLVSLAWTDSRTQTLLEARRDLVYVAAALLVVVACGRGAARALPGALLAAVVLVTVVALVRYPWTPLSSRRNPFVGGALLSWPLGYANGLAALAAVALPAAVALAAHGRSPRVRAAAGAATAPLVAVFVLGSSRGGTIAAVVALLVLLWLDPRRRAVGRVALRLLPFAAVVAAVSLASGLTHASLGASDVHRRGVVLLTVILVAALAAAGVSVRARADRRAEPPTLRALAAVAGAAVVVAALVTALPRLGGTGALRRLVGEARAAYWAAGWTQALAHPARGTGAGTFGRYWIVHGDAALGGALDVHNVYLETLGELGPLGLVLLLLVLAAPLVGVRRALATTRVGAAAAAGYVAFLVDALVEWDWELPSVTVAGLALGGALLVLGRRPRRTWPLSRPARAAGIAAALVLAAAALAGARSHALPSATAARPAAVAREPRSAWAS